jgi:GAF domain-containing protein
MSQPLNRRPSRRQNISSRTLGVEEILFADRAIDAVRFINLNAAQAIGLTVPQSFLVRGQGDRIIDVRYWPLADILSCAANVCFWGVKRAHRLMVPMCAYDPKRTSVGLFRNTGADCYSARVLAWRTAMSRRKPGKATKTQRRKALKRHDPRRTTLHLTSATSRELNEVRAQQAATAEILRVIRSSPTDLQSVFETIVRNAVSLCSSLFANVFRFDGELLHFVASHNVGPSYVDLLQAKYPMQPDSSQVSGRVMLTKSVIRIENVLTDPDYDQRFPQRMPFGRMLGIPLLREGDPIGVIVVGWVQAGPVVKAQEELLKTFADQAVIAIENTRLLKELSERTDQLEAQSQEIAKLNQQLERRVADQVGEIERMSRLRRFLPPQVADLIVASGAEKQLESHRREITALFCISAGSLASPKVRTRKT